MGFCFYTQPVTVMGFFFSPVRGKGADREKIKVDIMALHDESRVSDNQKNGNVTEIIRIKSQGKNVIRKGRTE